MTTNKKGFTLIELLVVIAIIGLLSTLAVVALSSARQRARDSKRLSDLKQLQTALELYYQDQASPAYPVAASAIALGSTNYACLNSASGFTTAGCSNPIMGLVPSDPGGTGGTTTYSYTSTSGVSYIITATLEGTVNGLSGNISLSPAGIQ